MNNENEERPLLISFTVFFFIKELHLFMHRHYHFYLETSSNKLALPVNTSCNDSFKIFIFEKNLKVLRSDDERNTKIELIT